MMIVHKPQDRMVSSEFALYETMLAFNPAQEAARKKFAENAFQRTREEAKEEESLLLELKRILARSEKLNEERRELYARLEAPLSSGNIGIYSSSQGLQSLLQQLMSVDKSKKRRLMGPDSASPASAGPSAIQQGFDRRDSSLRESVSGPSGPATKKGGAQGPTERRQLTEEEERTYGVSHPTDRITSGPFFRYEKLSKPVSLKSTAQQAKITNTLNELGLPPRLIMPTVETGAAYEILLESVVKMLQFRAVSEKLAGEIAVARTQKAEREKRERAARGEPEPEPEAEAAPDAADKEKEKEGEGDKDNENENDAGAPQPDGEADADANGDADADADATATANVPAEGDADAEGDVKMEEEREKSAAPSTRGGGSVHKRSASVLSTVSDKSTKRQKK